MTDRTAAWLEALEHRHLADFTPTEVARALRALSSCYVERRDRLPRGAALDSAGKRAAFALFYAPLHFIVTRAILAALPAATAGVSEVLDVGCGTGAAGAAWAAAAGVTAIRGIDCHPWAVAEATWTYRQFGLTGRAAQRDVSRAVLTARRGTAVVVAYTANELAEGARAALLDQLLLLPASGARALVIEPIARRAAPWWGGWEDRVVAAGGRADEWRFPSDLPPRPLALARAAGLDPRELTARTLYLPPASG